MTRIAGLVAIVWVSRPRHSSVKGSAQCRSSMRISRGFLWLNWKASSATVSCLPRLRAALSMASYSARSSTCCGRSSKSLR